MDFEDCGIVYILSNRAMPGCYKIGLTRMKVHKRIESLRSTSMPFDFDCVEVFPSSHVLQAEKHVHKSLKTNRVSKNREFFSFGSDELAASAVSRCLDSFKPKPYTVAEKKKARISYDSSTASQQAKSVGLKNLKQVTEITGAHRNTLRQWHRDKPDLFNIVLLGCIARLSTGE